MKKLIVGTLILGSFSAQAKLLDKVAGVINDKIITLSELKRVKNTIPTRQEIAPFLFDGSDYTLKTVLKKFQHTFIIKDKLSEMGYVISDDAVESRIAQTEKQLGLNREQLEAFLDSKGISFSEYFEIIRSAMEYNVFNSRIIGPLVTITDQEIKNFYYKQNANSKALSFKYKVVNFVISEDKVQKEDIAKLPNVLAKYRQSGNLPTIYSSFQTNDLGRLSGDDLPKDLNAVLKSTNEKDFSKPYIKDGQIHIFYLDEKNLAESSEFLQQKRHIHNYLFAKQSQKVMDQWFSKEILNYYILEDV